MSRQSEFRKIFPDVHPTVCEFFPDYDYRNPIPGAIVDMRDPKNCTGHQQRALTIWWAIEKCSSLDPGLDLGSPKGLTPLCIHVDIFGDGRRHPYYQNEGERYLADVAYDASAISEIVPANSVPYIASNHSLEHMPSVGDGGIVLILESWMSLLRGGGILALIVPDNRHFDVMGSDKDHKHAWGHDDFRPRVLDPLLAKGGVELVEYDTLDNHFSFNVVLKQTR